jgi:hypothetical protein
MSLLREIIHELAVNKDACLAIGALVSPFAVLVGVWASVLIANKNLRGSLIIKQRQHWINEVRNEVAAILAALNPLQVDFPSQENAARTILLMNELEVTRAKLLLLMDPKNTTHCELYAAATNAIEHAHEAREAKAKAREAKKSEAPAAKKPDRLDSLVSGDIAKLIDTTQKVLSETWEKARSLK